MNNYISCRKCDKKYCLIYIGHFFILIIVIILSFFLINNENKDFDFNSHSVFRLFLTYFGMFLFIIPELLLKLKTKNVNSENSDINRNKISNSAIQYIYNDLSDKTTWKDYIHIGIISFILLFIDFIKIFTEKKEKCQMNEYYFTTLPFLLFTSKFIYKTEFYKHQYISIIIITILGIYQYIIKINNYYSSHSDFLTILIDLPSQIIIGLGQAIYFSYIKVLMNYKFFSPYKVCYIFGLINMIIILIVLFIISGIECLKGNDLCTVKENRSLYFDNIYIIFKNMNIFQIFILLLMSICLGALKLLINLIINYYTVFHIFVFLQNNGLSDTINQEIINQTNPFIQLTIAISHLIDFIFSLVFLEILEFKCFGLNKNYKENIKKRVEEENRISSGENNNVDENEDQDQDNSFSNEDSQD